METNPYQAPEDYPDDARDTSGGPIQATIVIDRSLMYRAVHFHVLRRRLFERYLFFASTALLIMLLSLLWIDAPRHLEISFAVLFGLCHVLQVVLPHLWTRAIMRRMQADSPDVFGEHQVSVNAGQLACTMRADTSWRIDQVNEVFFLGDMLLLCPEPGVLIPVPHTADFGRGSFYGFCERFSIALRF